MARVLYGKTGKSPTSRRQRGRGRRGDFMSRNSLGSPTFMFYPVIMMSTYMLDETKHYPTSFLSSVHVTPGFLARFKPQSVQQSSSSSSLSSTSSFLVIGIRLRRGNATHFSDRSPERWASLFRLYFEPGILIDTIQGTSVYQYRGKV